MNSRFGFIVLLLLSNVAWGVDAPRYATELRNFSSAGKASNDEIRMRISLASDVVKPERSVRVANVLLCSISACYRASTSGYADVENTSRGSAHVIADVILPIATITDVYFPDVTGNAVVNGHLKLESPLILEKGFQGVELLIVLRRTQTGGQTRFIPVQSAGMYFHPENALVRYMPSVQTVASLSHGATLTIPVGALAKPQIFNIGVMDPGGIFPAIDIYPYMKLDKAAHVDARALRRGSASRDWIVPAVPSAPSASSTASAAQTTSGPITSSRIAILQTSLIKSSAFEHAGTAGPEP